MKKKIMISFLVIFLIIMVIKISNFVMINKTYKAIENFKENDNRYYCVYQKDSNEKYNEKIFLKDGIVKYIFSKNNDDLYYEWKNTSTNEYYYIDIQNKIVNFNEEKDVYRRDAILYLPRMITSVFCDSNNKYVSSFLEIKYIIPTKYEDKNCFKIVTASETLIIDADTYLPRYLLRELVNSEGENAKIETFYEFDVGIVTEDDVALPDLSEYQIIE